MRSRKMVRKLKSSSLSEFSSKLIKFQYLPNGTEIRLYRKNTQRRVRSDFTVKRKSINSKNIDRMHDTWNVKDFLDEAKELLSTDIEARGFEMLLFAPDGSKINGNTLLGTVRDLEPLIKEDSDESITLFSLLLQNCGLDDTDDHQIKLLYNQLNEILDNTLNKSLVKNERKILKNSL